MICKKCGSVLDDSYRFCTHCGARVAAEEAPADAAPAVREDTEAAVLETVAPAEAVVADAGEAPVAMPVEPVAAATELAEAAVAEAGENATKPVETPEAVPVVEAPVETDAPDAVTAAAETAEAVIAEAAELEPVAAEKPAPIAEAIAAAEATLSEDAAAETPVEVPAPPVDAAPKAPENEAPASTAPETIAISAEEAARAEDGTPETTADAAPEAAAEAPEAVAEMPEASTPERCPACGTALQPGDLFCPACGAAVVPAAKKRKKWPWFVAAAAAVVALAVLLVVLLLPKRSPWTPLSKAMEKTIESGSFSGTFQLYDSGNGFMPALGANYQYAENSDGRAVVMSDGFTTYVAFYKGYEIVYAEDYACYKQELDDSMREFLEADVDELLKKQETGDLDDLDLRDILEQYDAYEEIRPMLEEHVDLDALNAGLRKLPDYLNDEQWLREHAGFEIVKNGNASTYSFTLDARFLRALLETVEPAFRDPADLEEAYNALVDPDALGFSALFTFTIEDGYWSGLTMQINTPDTEIRLEVTCSDFGTTVIDTDQLDSWLEMADEY